MQIPRTRGGRAALAATALGTVLLLAAGYLTFFDESSKAPTAESLTAGTQPPLPGEDEIPESLEDLVSPDTDSVTSVTGVSGDDPFARASGSDNTLHKVVIKFVSDGGMYAGWRYRTKGGEGLKVADNTLTVSKSVRGGLPVAQAAVQVLSTASYASCTIYVDGVAVVSQTAKGANHVTVCVG